MEGKKIETIVVTRHAALVDLLRERGVVGECVRVMEHVGPEDVRGMHVVGVLPISLASLAETVTVVPIDFGRSAEARGSELTIHQLRYMAGKARTYTVREVSLHKYA